MLATALVAPAILWTQKLIIDSAEAALTAGLPWTAALTPLLVMFALWTAQMLSSAVNGVLQTLLQERVRIKGQSLLLETAGNLDLAFFESPRFYDQLHHARDQMYQLYSSCIGTLTLIQQFLQLSVTISLLLVLHPLAIAVLIVTTLPDVVVQAKYARRYYTFDADLIRNSRMSFYLSDIVTNRYNAKEVRVFSLKDYFIEQFHYFRNIYIEGYRALIMSEMKVQSALSVLALVGIAGIWTYAVMQLVSGQISTGDLVLVFTSSQQSRQQLAGLIRGAGRFYRNSLFVTRFFQFIDLDPLSVEGALAPPPSPNPLPFPYKIRKGIEFKDVCFTYPLTDAQILKKVSFSVPPRGKIAIVGQNGAGKTTIIKLLTRLYDPTEGTVLVDGVDLKEYDLKQVRQNISVVFQDFSRYDLSASLNVGLGHVSHIDDMDRIRDAAIRGGSHETIEELPEGYDTILGKRFDDGVDLSGGEWQHVAISRSFMSPAQVLILDEPTAALDALKEHQLYEKFSELTKDKTVVFISHRFSTVRMADVIVVIENGEAIEVGPHEELLALNGKYAKMFLTQAARYVD